jgi:quercetin dioxygenase-like cupin family protein
MRYLLAIAILIGAAVLLSGAGGGAVTYVGHDKVDEALAKGGSLATGPDLSVTGNVRKMAGEVEVHDKETDIFHVIEGEATVVTGGTMTGGKQTKAGQWRGTGINGGETHHLTKGDVMVIPAGTPHWFKEVPKSISYYTVKVIKQ